MKGFEVCQHITINVYFLQIVFSNIKLQLALLVLGKDRNIGFFNVVC